MTVPLFDRGHGAMPRSSWQPLLWLTFMALITVVYSEAEGQAAAAQPSGRPVVDLDADEYDVYSEGLDELEGIG